MEQISNLNTFEFKQNPKLNKFWKLNKNSKLIFLFEQILKLKNKIKTKKQIWNLKLFRFRKNKKRNSEERRKGKKILPGPAHLVEGRLRDGIPPAMSES
jgi:hypothetical protein